MNVGDLVHAHLCVILRCEDAWLVKLSHHMPFDVTFLYTVYLAHRFDTFSVEVTDAVKPFLKYFLT